MADSETKRRPRLPSLPDLPHLPEWLAAAIVGLVCGLATVGLVRLGEEGCTAVEGRPSCGGVGLVMLTAIVVVAYLLGIYLLRIFLVQDPGLVSFFGVTLPLIVILAFLMDIVLDSWMIVVLPLLSAACFAGGAVLARSLRATPAQRNDDLADGETEDVDAQDDDEAATDAMPSYAPPDDDADETQPLVVATRSATDETTMLTPVDSRDADVEADEALDNTRVDDSDDADDAGPDKPR